LCKAKSDSLVKQWFDQDDAPELQTLSFNGRVGEKVGAGIIVLMIKNGYHSQKVSNSHMRII
jgi:hypothetical protein